MNDSWGKEIQAANRIYYDSPAIPARRDLRHGLPTLRRRTLPRLPGKHRSRRGSEQRFRGISHAPRRFDLARCFFYSRERTIYSIGVEGNTMWSVTWGANRSESSCRRITLHCDRNIGSEERAWKLAMSYLCKGFEVFDILKDGEPIYGESHIASVMAKQYRVFSLLR